MGIQYKDLDYRILHQETSLAEIWTEHRQIPPNHKFFRAQN